MHDEGACRSTKCADVVIASLHRLVEVRLSIAWIGLAQDCVITPRPFDVRID